MHGGKLSYTVIHAGVDRSAESIAVECSALCSGHRGDERKPSWIPVPGYKPEANAKREVGDPDSIFSYYQKLIRLRKELPVIASGKIRFLNQDNDAVMAYERYYDAEAQTSEAKEEKASEAEHIVVYCSFSKDAVTAWVPENIYCQKVLLSNYPGQNLPENGRINLRPFEAVVMEAVGEK